MNYHSQLPVDRGRFWETNVEHRRATEGLRVERVTLVGAFRPDSNAALKLGTSLSVIADSQGGQVAQIPVPASAPPHIPRVMLGTGQQVVNVCLDRVQVTVSPPSQVANSIDGAFDFVAGIAERLLSPLLSLDWMKEQWCGVIVEICLPFDTFDQTEATKFAAMMMTQVDWAGDDIKSFEMQIGRQKGLFFNTFRVSTYERRTAQFAVLPGESVSFEELHEKSEVLEVGLSLSIDVNNRPDPGRGSNVEELLRVLGEAKKEIGVAVTGLMPTETLL